MSEALLEKDEILLQFTAQIVASHVANNVVQSGDLPEIIDSVYKALETLGAESVEEPEEELKPMVPIKKSVTDDHIICLECGNKMKMLRRHLSSDHGMTPEEYRSRWNLQSNYPMVAPSYARKRQELAKKIGLGRNRGKR